MPENIKLNTEKLLRFGFTEKDGAYRFVKDIANGEFRLTVTAYGDTLETELTDNESGEDYSLYKTSAEGPFVGGIRHEVGDVLSAISIQCAERDPFFSRQTSFVLDYSREKYGAEPEYLFRDSPDCAVLRRTDTGKWIGIIMTIKKRRLGIDSDETVEVINLHTEPEKMASLLSEGGLYPGWHMNKKYWYTVILDGSVPDGTLASLIDESYSLAKPKEKRGKTRT